MVAVHVSYVYGNLREGDGALARGQYTYMHACMYVYMYVRLYICTVQTVIPAPVDRTSASAWLYKTPMDGMSKISDKDINDTRNLQTKASFSSEVIHASIP